MFYFENALFLQLSVRSEQKKVNKLLLVKQQAWGKPVRVGGGGDNCRSLLIDTMAHRHKILRYFTLCDTNTVISNITSNSNSN